jgi:hypothetical protein
MGKGMEIGEQLGIVASPSFEEERRHDGKRVGLAHCVMTV